MSISDADVSEPWRKNFDCKPYSNDMADGERFLRDLEEAADGIDCDKEWTHGSVLRGEHEGGGAATAIAIPAANNAANNKKRNLRTKRLQSVHASQAVGAQN